MFKKKYLKYKKKYMELKIKNNIGEATIASIDQFEDQGKEADAKKKAEEETAKSNENTIYEWLTHLEIEETMIQILVESINNENYKNIKTYSGVTPLKELKNLTEDDIEKLINLVEMNVVHKNKFKSGLQTLREAAILIKELCENGECIKKDIFPWLIDHGVFWKKDLSDLSDIDIQQIILENGLNVVESNILKNYLYSDLAIENKINKILKVLSDLDTISFNLKMHAVPAQQREDADKEGILLNLHKSQVNAMLSYRLLSNNKFNIKKYLYRPSLRRNDKELYRILLKFANPEKGWFPPVSEYHIDIMKNTKCHKASFDQKERATCYLYSFITLFINERSILNTLKKLTGWIRPKKNTDNNWECTSETCSFAKPTPEAIKEIVKLLTHFKRYPDACPLIPTWMNYYIYGESTKGAAKEGGHEQDFIIYTLLACEKVYPNIFRIYIPQEQYFNDPLSLANLTHYINEFKNAKTYQGLSYNIGCITIRSGNVKFDPKILKSEYIDNIKSHPDSSYIKAFTIALCSMDSNDKHHCHAISGYICNNEIKLCNSWGKDCDDPYKIIYNEFKETRYILYGITLLLKKDNDENVEILESDVNNLMSYKLWGGPDSIGEFVFGNKNLTQFTIPNSIKSIGELAFHGNKLTHVIIPDSVETIGEFAFYNNKLTTVEIGKSVKTIGRNAFHGNKLTHVIIPDSVETIDEFAFYNNLDLKRVYIPEHFKKRIHYNINSFPERVTLIKNSDETIWPYIFQDNNLTQFTIPNSVKTIGPYAFQDNKLTQITIPDSVETIGQAAFQDNELTTVEIGKSVETIGINAFQDNKLTTVEIGKSVKTIGLTAFRSNELTTVEIGKSVKTIGREAFFNNKLTSVTIPDSVKEIGFGAFQDNPDLKTVYIPKHFEEGKHYFEESFPKGVTLIIMNE